MKECRMSLSGLAAVETIFERMAERFGTTPDEVARWTYPTKRLALEIIEQDAVVLDTGNTLEEATVLRQRVGLVARWLLEYMVMPWLKRTIRRATGRRETLERAIRQQNGIPSGAPC